jgi:hypothetical protein
MGTKPRDLKDVNRAKSLKEVETQVKVELVQLTTAKNQTYQRLLIKKF